MSNDILVTTEEQLRRFYAEACRSRCRAASLDLECTGKSPHTDKIVGVAFSFVQDTYENKKSFYVPVAHRFKAKNFPLEKLKSVIESRSWVAFNGASFEYSFLKKAGIKFKVERDRDPFIMGVLLQKTGVLSLKDWTAHLFQRTPPRLEDVLGSGKFDYSWADLRKEISWRYPIQDVKNVLDVFNELEKRTEKRNQLAIAELETKAAMMMADQSLNGYEVDMKKIVEAAKDTEVGMEALKNEIFSLTGWEEFKLNSPKQLAEHLFGPAKGSLGLKPVVVTKSSMPSCAAPALEQIADQHDVIPLYMKWRSMRSVLSNLDKMGDYVVEDLGDGKVRIAPEWRSMGFADATARMYAAAPSLTSIPMKGRTAFDCSKGEIWLSFDWSQAEMRFLALFSKNERLKEMLESTDFHAAVARNMFGTPLNVLITYEQREVAKTITYATLYSGGNPKHISSLLKVDFNEAHRLLEKYFAVTGLKSFVSKIRNAGARTHHVKTYQERLRKLSGNSRTRSNMAINSIGQQSVGTLAKMVLIEMWEKGLFEEYDVKEIVPVFDAVFFKLPFSRAQDFYHRIKGRVEADVEREGFKVKMQAKWFTGPDWAAKAELD